jgi:hypothetical protein
MHKAIYSLYQIEIIRHSSDELTVRATNRFDRVFYAHIKRDKDNYWVGGADFEVGNKRAIKGIVWEFSLGLLRECREYDQRWYDFHCMTRLEENGETRPLTWEETDRGNLRFQEEQEPTFKGSVKFYTERYEN